MASAEDVKICGEFLKCFKKLVPVVAERPSPYIEEAIDPSGREFEVARFTDRSPTSKFILRPGCVINPADYDPSNTEAQRNLATFVDVIPKISETWESRNAQISSQWRILLSTGKAPVGNVDPSLKKQYEEAKKKLYIDYDTLEKSSFYNSLDTALKEVAQKELDLVKLKTKVREMLGPNATKTEYDELYAKMSPPYLAAVEIAEQQYAFRKNEVQRNLSILNAYTTESPETVLMKMNISKYWVGKGHIVTTVRILFQCGICMVQQWV